METPGRNASKQEWLRVSVLCAVVLAAVGIFHERWMASHDPVNFVLALKYGYSIADQRPHPPGYPAFFVLWKSIQWVTNWQPHRVILVLNGFFAVAAIVLTWGGARKLYGEKVGWWSAVWVATNPLFLYYSCTAEIYTYDAAFSAFLVILLLAPPKRFAVLLYGLLGFLGSFRLSSVILELPVILWVLGFGVYRGKVSWSQAGARVVAVVVGTALWLIPFILYLGGVAEFRHVFRDAAYLPTTFAQNLSTLIPYLVWFLNLGWFLLFLRRKQLLEVLKCGKVEERVLVLLIIVPLLFFALKFYAKGYALIVAAPVAILLIDSFARNYESRSYKWIAVIGNLFVFFLVPFVAPSIESVKTSEHRTLSERTETAIFRGTSFFAPTLSHLRRSDRDIESIRGVLGQVPDSSLVVIDNSAVRWAYPRSLEYLFPTLGILVTESSGSMKIYQGQFDGKPFEGNGLQTNQQLYYLTTTDFEPKLSGLPAMHLFTKDQFSLYEVALAQRDRFREFISSFFKSDTTE